ncbi:MAG: NAD(P)/FAD-dependent oxidoreductase [Dehalococcoidia bacterium]
MKIGIIGSGISGLSLCYFLNKFNYDVTLIEKESKLGGHTNSHTIEGNTDGGLKIDTGFIVFNDKNYPKFLEIMNTLDVDYANSDMSFSYWNSDKNKGYSGKSISGLMPDSFFDFEKINLLKNIYKYTKILKNDYIKGNLKKSSLFEYFNNNNYPNNVVDNYFLPLASAIWSSPTNNIQHWNADFFAQFYMNHGLLDFRDRPSWKYIKNGSISYIEKIINHTNPKIILNTEIKKIISFQNKVTVFTGSKEMVFDKVFISTHADQAFSMLQSSDLIDTYSSLNEWKYSNNHVYLHTDTKLLPPKKYWASWNYMENNSNEQKHVSISYNMNFLNKICSDKTYVVSLNPIFEPNQDKILYETFYQHPVFDHNSLNTRKIIKSVNGQYNVFFAGSYMGNGFHEDGVKSAYDAFKKFVISIN